MKMVALLRGINVGGNKKVPMPDLCALATKVGLSEVKHYINSGNIVFNAGTLEPDQVVTLLEDRCNKDISAQLDERATQGEKIKVVGDAIWVDFVKSIGKSKLTPAVFDKAAGSMVTMRNWNTVLKLDEMLGD